MTHVRRQLPVQPHLDIPKREARELQKQVRAADKNALERVRSQHPRFSCLSDVTLAAAAFRLTDAQLVLAREYGFASWPELKQRIDANTAAGVLLSAISVDDVDAAIRLVKTYPSLLHLPLRSANWGPPMSHAANLGHLKMVEALAALGARDFQHAFDRAVLQGKLECARWLHAQGITLWPGIVMGPCETLNVEGLRFLAELGAPLTDKSGDRLAPLAMILETYSRWPERKHACLEQFVSQGTQLPDTPLMAFHRGQVERLAQQLEHDPNLLDRRFSYREIYPPGLGCHDDGRSGLHGTPLDGTTLLHLAIDFDEQEIFDLLLAHGADVNARANYDSEGFGGHTPLYNAIVSDAYLSGRQRDSKMARTLLARGASTKVRTDLRKFLDWRESPGWHDAKNVTPAEWGRHFPERDWVNVSALALLEKAD